MSHARPKVTRYEADLAQVRSSGHRIVWTLIAMISVGWIPALALFVFWIVSLWKGGQR